jgi:hypothetical protein
VRQESTWSTEGKRKRLRKANRDVTEAVEEGQGLDY